MKFFAASSVLYTFGVLTSVCFSSTPRGLKTTTSRNSPVSRNLTVSSRQNLGSVPIKGDVAKLKKWLTELLDPAPTLEKFEGFLFKIFTVNEERIRIFKAGDYVTKFNEMFYYLAIGSMSNRPVVVMYEIMDLVDIVDNAKKSRHRLPEDFLDKHEVIFSNILLMMTSYLNFINRMESFTKTKHEGSFLYGPVMNYTGEKMGSDCLDVYIEFLKCIREFYQAFLNSYTSKLKTTAKTLELEKNLAKIRSSVTLCEKRKALMKAFKDLGMEMKQNFSIYQDRCDFSEKHLNILIRKIPKDSSKAKPFFTALGDFAEARKIEFGNDDSQANMFLKIVDPFKLRNPQEQMRGAPPTLPAFNVILRKSSKPVSLKTNFNFVDVSVKKLIPSSCTMIPFKKSKDFRFERADFTKSSPSILNNEYYTIYKGINRKTGTPVAIKEYAVVGKRSFIEELFYMNRLKNAPFTCQLHFWQTVTRNLIRSHSNLVLVMDFSETGLYSTYISKKWRNDLEREQIANQWMAQIVVAFQHMHARGIVHPGLFLDNIRLDSSDKVQICNFDPTSDVKNLQPSSLLFVPPEKYNNDHQDGYETNIFALGMIFYHLIAHNPENTIPNLNLLVQELQKISNFNDLRKFAGMLDYLPVRGDAPVGAEALFRGMVHPEPQKRFTLVQIMKSEYFNDIDWKQLGALEAPLKN